MRNAWIVIEVVCFGLLGFGWDCFSGGIEGMVDAYFSGLFLGGGSKGMVDAYFKEEDSRPIFLKST